MTEWITYQGIFIRWRLLLASNHQLLEYIFLNLFYFNFFFTLIWPVLTFAHFSLGFVQVKQPRRDTDAPMNDSPRQNCPHWRAALMPSADFTVFVINPRVFIIEKDNGPDWVLIKTLLRAGLIVPSWRPCLINDVTLAIWSLTQDYFSPVFSSIRAE